MRVALFGATGATGREVLAALLAAGIEVTALCRRQGALSPSEGLGIVTGSLREACNLQATIAGTDAVCCLFGPRPPYDDIFCAEATRIIVTLMQQRGPRQLICQTGGMIGDGRDNRSWAMQRMTQLFNKRYAELAADRVEQERIVMASGLDWTILKPPRLSDGPARLVITGDTVQLGMLSSIHRASIAVWIVGELQKPRHTGRRLFMRDSLF